jgi:hypothetical protein
VREQTTAIRRALPQFIAHELKIPTPSTADADRLSAFYRTSLEKNAKALGRRFRWEFFIRDRAEEQVRWKVQPEQALVCLLNTIEPSDETLSHIRFALDKSKKRGGKE